MIVMGDFYCGTSGLVLPAPNKQAFPEAYRAGTRLTYYASLFNSIEVNSSFYTIPQPKTFYKWAEEVPLGFRFTVKLWRGITHHPGLSFVSADVERFIRATGGLGGKRGCLLVQLPPGVRMDKSGQLEKLLEDIVRTDADRLWKIAVEFRHSSWYTPETGRLLERFGAGLVLQDIPVSRIREPMGNTSFIYVRYHGPAGNYRGGYPDEFLKEEARSMKKWLSEGRQVYVYFNNTIGDALKDAECLRRWVSSNGLTGGG
jgi:uncharacterized protein YecE (DUF72 family)